MRLWFVLLAALVSAACSGAEFQVSVLGDDVATVSICPDCAFQSGQALPTLVPSSVLPSFSASSDPCAFSHPYAGQQYWVTQGVRPGHDAIDVSAGKGARTHSPINGVVVQSYTDQYGNPTLVIENDCYQVVMLHGEWVVPVGSPVESGQLVGYEGNMGYTVDMNGKYCGAGSACGYHLHINVFDKWQGRSVTAELMG